jgi:curved DNA-binding protein CbpA
VLGLTSSATVEDVTKAYRTLSRSLHPDKVKQKLRAERAKLPKAGDKTKKKPGVNVAKAPTNAEIKAAVAAASDAQARLSLIVNILRGPGRDRYDHFLANGFPVWKGTGYYYNRYRPGLGTALFGCFLVGGGGMHYLALYMSWRRQREFVGRYITFARNAAWGDSLGLPVAASVPGIGNQDSDDSDSDAVVPAVAVNRREKRMQQKEKKKGKETGGKKGRKAAAAAAAARGGEEAGAAPTGARKRVLAENGKVLIVDSVGDVWLEEEDEEGNTQEFLLDVSQHPCPSPLWKPPFYSNFAGWGKKQDRD